MVLAVPPVERAIEADLARLPVGSKQLAAVRGLGDSLRRRAALDDEAPGRRAARMPDIVGTARKLWPEFAGEPNELLESLFTGAATPVRRAVTDAEDARSLADIAEWLIETDLPDTAGRLADRMAPDPSTMYQVKPAPSVSPEQVLDCLRAHDHAGSEISAVSELRVLSGGFSKEMLRATVEYPAGPRDIVIRKVARGRTADTLGGEFAALSFAWKHHLPVPEPLWLDESALGTPAFATGMSAGRCLGDVWGPAEPVSADTARALARTLARLHALDTADLPGTPLPPMRARSEILAAIDERREVLDTVADAVQPYAALFALVLAWLREHAPGDVVRPVLVHGDFGLHNILIDNAEPSALLDWERAHVGDPAEDLAYVRPSVEAILPWDDFLRAYQDAGGPEPDPRRLAYYTVWHDIWRGVSAYRIRAKFLADPARISDAMAGLLMSPRFLIRAARNAFGRRATAC